MQEDKGIKKICLIGFPIRHSLSPIFQQAAFDFYHLPIRYHLLEITHEHLPKTMSLLRDSQFLGANITIPYKEAVIPYLDGLEGEASQIRVVNTIVKEGERLKGYNTDVFGFGKVISDVGFEARGKTIAILGAGGAALAVAYALIDAGALAIYFINRTISRAEEAVLRLKPMLKRFQRMSAFPLSWGGLKELLKGSHMIVNATPIGLAHSPWENQTPIPGDLIPEGIFVYDLIYNPPKTPLLRMAEERFCKIENGFKMLIYQGALSFKLWTGLEPPIDIMFSSIR